MANSSPTRRNLSRGGAAVAAVSTVAAVPVLAAAEPGDDAELIRLCEAFHRQHAAMGALPDDAMGAALGARQDTYRLIQDMRPVTERGRGAKASVAVVLLVEYGEPAGLIQFALATLRD